LHLKIHYRSKVRGLVRFFNAFERSPLCSNHSNILIWCSRSISNYYRCWNHLCCFIFFVETM